MGRDKQFARISFLASAPAYPSRIKQCLKTYAAIDLISIRSTVLRFLLPMQKQGLAATTARTTASEFVKPYRDSRFHKPDLLRRARCATIALRDRCRTTHRRRPPLRFVAHVFRLSRGPWSPVQARPGHASLQSPTLRSGPSTVPVSMRPRPCATPRRGCCL